MRMSGVVAAAIAARLTHTVGLKLFLLGFKVAACKLVGSSFQGLAMLNLMA